MDWGELLDQVGGFVSWLGIHPTGQDAVKAALLIVFALITLMILGDIYRGEIQNTMHRVRVIGNPRRDHEYRNSLQLPKYMVPPTLDGVYSDVILYYRYRDFRGRLRTRRLKTYRARLRVRPRFTSGAAFGRERDHEYSEEELDRVAKEKPDLDAAGRAGSEIVALAKSRADYINELWGGRMARAHSKWSKLERSRVRRFFVGVRSADLREPEQVGLLVKFHFPINPHFLLYRHPDSNVRSTAWLTVLTSCFAIFMQLVYSPGSTSETTITASARVEQTEVYPTVHKEGSKTLPIPSLPRAPSP